MQFNRTTGTNAPKKESSNEVLTSPDSPPASLVDLPHELLLQIIDEMDDAALCSLGCTCKDLNTLIFPLLFDKLNINNPSQGSICCFRAPEHTLRAIRCSLPTKNIRNIYYYFSKEIERLVEEVEDMHAIVRRTDEVTNFEVYLAEPDRWTKPDCWALSDAPRLDEAQALRLTSEEWTKLYVGLLTTSLTKGCKRMLLSGGRPFLKFLQDRDQTTAESVSTAPALLLQEQILGNKPTRYFDGSFQYERAGPRKPQPQVTESVEKLSQDTGPSWSKPILTQSSDLNKVSTQSKASPPDRTKAPPTSKIESLVMHSDMFFASPSFLDWTNQLLSWCGPTLTHFELQCPKTPSGIWCKFLSEITLPSLTHFEVASNLVVGEANMQGSDILSFLGRHPGIQKLKLHGIQVPKCLSTLPEAEDPILPNLSEVIAHPIYISWLLRNETQCPELKEVVLSTECYVDVNLAFPYNAMDRALRDLLPRSHKLDVIGFRFTSDRSDLDSWLQSHVDAGPNISILPNFIDTKRLRINVAFHVQLINRSRLDLIARFVGLFPNLDYLELQDQPGDLHNKADYYPITAKALRSHSPQVKKVKINTNTPTDIKEIVL
ncbi:hypothetical protein H1R20_g15887, partial [Candolleomyces eurysporus]